MCGILITAGLHRSFSHTDLRSLRARGPDGVGFWTDPHVNIGHTRLAILGLSDRSTEPYENEQHVLAFNGEIYNFGSLLHRLGDPPELVGANDGEVLLHAWTRFGAAILSDLEGFWAFVVYDKHSNTLSLVRDQIGVKPLYYWASGTRICVASMLRTIRDILGSVPDLDYEALSEYAAYQFTFGDKTFLAGLRKVLPGHIVRIELKTGSVRTTCYEDIFSPGQFPAVAVDPDWIEQTRELLVSSVLDSTISDTPITTLCSGGIDSSLVTRIVAPDLAYHGNYSDPDCNETFFARQAVEGTGTRLYVVNADESFNLVDKLASIVEDFDELTIGSVILPLDDVLAQVARRYKVVLTGTGGDELFGGYVRYQLALGDCYQDSYRSVFESMRDVPVIADRFQLTHRKGDTGYFRFYQPHVEDTFRKSFEDCRLAGDDTQAMLTFDRRYFLSGLLNIDDKMAARHSLESRPSLLHQRLVRHLALVDGSALVKDADLKSVLRTIASPLLPKPITHRTDKMGFTTPIGTFIRESSDLIRQHLTTSPFGELYSIRRLNFAPEHKFSREVFGLLMLDLWLRRYAA